MAEKRIELFSKILKYLKEKGIDDPNIDMFLAVEKGDTAALHKAVENGADVNITDSELIQKYQDYLRDEPISTTLAEWLIEVYKK